MDINSLRWGSSSKWIWIFGLFSTGLGCNRKHTGNVIINAKEGIFSDPVVVGYVDNNKAINEISGIAQSRRHKDVLYVLNDSGGKASIYALNSTNAKLIATLKINGAVNCDWEDIAVGTGPYGHSYIYIGDIGGNTVSTCETIYRVMEPLSIEDSTLEIHGKIKFSWDASNCETMMVDQKGTLYLVSKVDAGAIPKLYQVPNFAWSLKQINIQGGTDLAITTGSKGPVAGDISKSGQEILIKTYNNIYYWKRSKSSDILQILQQVPANIPYIAEPQGEAICWGWQDEGFYTVSEGLNQPLYYYKRNKA